MPRVIHFEIPASDPERAAAFYKKTFGWKIEKWPGPTEYWLVTTGPFWGHPAPRNAPRRDRGICDPEIREAGERCAGHAISSVRSGP